MSLSALVITQRISVALPDEEVVLLKSIERGFSELKFKLADEDPKSFLADRKIKKHKTQP